MNDVVKQIEDAAIKVKEAGVPIDSFAGGVALEFALNAQRLDVSVDERAPLDGHRGSGVGEPLKRLAEWSGLEPDLLGDAFEIGDDAAIVALAHGHLSKRKSERQRQLALLKLSVDRIAYERQTVPARELNAICEKYDCMDQNLPRNVQEGNLITRRGPRGAYDYRVTLEGTDAARDLLRQFLNAR